ncbi:MAG: hypothetical protein ACR2NM_03800 [Bythopirellula sp.]
MQNSGTKLVLGLLGVALALGMISWCYRYAAAHRASQFWGPEAARLIGESAGFEALRFQPDPVQQVAGESPSLGGIDARTRAVDLSKARGQAHLRHALLSDRNYLWDQPVDAEAIDWQWTLRFYEGERQALVTLSKDLRAIGKTNLAEETITAYCCEPMTSSLKQYFDDLGLPLEAAEETASTAAE